MRPLYRLTLTASLTAWMGVLWACTPTSQPTRLGSQPSWRTTTIAAANGQPGDSGEPRRLAPLVFAPPGAAVPLYNGEPPADVPSSPLTDSVAGAIEQFYRDAGQKPPVRDARLYAAASEMALSLPEDGALPYPIIEFALQRQGVIEPSPNILPVIGSLDRPEPMLEQIARRLPSILAREEVTHIGIGTARGNVRGQDTLLILLLRSQVSTAPIPREITNDRPVAIEGETHGDYREPAVYITHEDGFVVKPPIQVRDARRFRAELSCAGRRGRQQVEITAISAAGSNVLANFPVWCHEQAPASVTVEPSEDDIAPVASVAEAEARMLALVNRDREAASLAPLALSEELSLVARRHSEEMRDAGFVAHVSPTTGSADNRVRVAGIRTALVLENVARAYGVSEAQAGLMNSPGHRANLLSDRASHIGIGIAFEEAPGEGRIMFITQLFMRAPSPFHAGRMRAELHARIAKKRGKAVSDPALTAIAQAYVDTVVVPGMSDSQAAAWRKRHFDGLRARFGRVGTTAVTVIDLQSFDVDEAFREPWVTHYGLGLAQGFHPELGDGSIFIVILLAQTH